MVQTFHSRHPSQASLESGNGRNALGAAAGLRCGVPCVGGGQIRANKRRRVATASAVVGRWILWRSERAPSQRRAFRTCRLGRRASLLLPGADVLDFLAAGSGSHSSSSSSISFPAGWGAAAP